MGRTDIEQFLSKRNNPLGKMEGVTNKCFVKQELCLYPFPHLSHLSSLPLLTRIPFADNAGPDPVPSLARRFRGAGLTSGACPSAMALPLSTAVLFPGNWGVPLNPPLSGPPLGRLLGGLGYPCSAKLSGTFPCSLGRDAAPGPDVSPYVPPATSLMAWATAAIFVPAVDDMLLRRVMRC